ncbi:MAG: glycoside hydrolase family 25 protein [Chitinophagaceae bacterium]|nr:MAG: glycoside hydrolase family 25 protein [Chitinophagaceae bacterium]
MASKTSKRTRQNRLIIILVLAAFAVAIFLLRQFYKRPAFVNYPAFGIYMPTSYTIHGIDVSRYQKTIGWRLVKDMQVDDIRIGFAFMKATEGMDRVDPQFKRNWTQAKKAGIPRGAYHFFIASRSGKAQAAHFLENVRLRPGDLPPVLDVEQTNGASVTDLQQRVADWLMMVEKAYKVKPIIYTNVDFYKNFLAGRFDDYPLWVAHYLVKDKPRIKRPWQFWQHSERGRANGIDAFVDFNVFNGDSTAFNELLLP